MRTVEPRGGIERKILTVVIWVGMLPMILALIIGYANAREGQRKAVQQTLASSAKDRATGFELAANAHVDRVHALADDPALVAHVLQGTVNDTFLRQMLGPVLTETAQSSDGESVFTVYDAKGEPVATTGDANYNIPGISDYLSDDSKARFVNIRYLYTQSRFVGLFLTPILVSGSDKPVGYLSEESGIDSLLTYVLAAGAHAAGQRLSADSYQFVYLGNQGAYLKTELKEERPDDPKQCQESIAQVLWNAGDRDSNSQFLTVSMSRNVPVPVLLAYHRLGYYRTAFIVAYRPTAVAYSNINYGALLSIAASVFVILILCFIAYRNIHKNIVLPLSLLNEGAQIIRQGDLDLKLKIGTGDEIEELASSFNKMALALRTNIRQLEESEEKYRGLVTSMRDGIYQADLDGVLTFLNPAGLEIFGFTRTEDAIGIGLDQLFVDSKEYQRLLGELGNKGFVERTRVWMKRRDGRTICTEITGNRIYDEQAQPMGIEGIFRDVTKSVRLEQDVRERAERISAINQIANVINSSLEAGLLFESLVVEIKKLVDFDYAAVALLDEEASAFETRQLWPEREMPPGSVYTLDNDTSCAAQVAQQRKCLIVDDLLADGSPYADEFPEAMQSFICVPLYANDRIIGTINLASRQKAAFSKHDIEVMEQVAPHVAVAIRNGQLLENLQASLEEVTQAREKLHQANEELKTLDEMKTNLLSNVSHELRTPLVAVMGYTDMIVNEKVGPVNNVQREYLGISLRNIEKLVTLIENLLDFSRLHRGAEKLVFNTFDLAEVARTSMEIVQPVADGREIELILNAPETPVNVEGDKGKLGQVFNNLLSNAVKFNQSGGNVTIDIHPSEEDVEVLVSDTGIGIPPEALDKVFTRFYQYDSSSTRKYGGTGIGLAIAQDIARLHGSRITVTSEVGKGAVFRFVLPLAGVHLKRGEPGLAGSELPGETHLLIELVTQDRALSTQVRNLLVSEGMDVIHASNPEYAISLASKHRPDCIVVDGENDGQGAGVMEALLGDSLTGSIPIALLTNDEKLYEAYHSSVASRIKRSFRKSTLLSGIRFALRPHTDDATPLGNKILCVDDDTEILTFIQRCLEADNYAVDGCTSGEAALKMLASREYSLVLLDIAMPGIDGWETCRELRNDPSMAGLKIYMVTAKPVDSSTQRLKEVQADGYLMKPFRPEDLSALVQSLGIPETSKES